MKKIAAKWKGFGFLLVLVSVLFLLGGFREVSADSTVMYKVTFANSKGDSSSGNYRKWTGKVEAGSTIELPKVTRKGYEVRWVATINGKQRKYSPGSSFVVRKNVKFCLKCYKQYTIRYYSPDGKKEYKSLRETAIKGERISLPSVPSASGYRNYGWAKTVSADKATAQRGDTVRVSGNIRFYAVRKKLSGVQLYKNNGNIWKTITATADEKLVFPNVATENGDMFLGWSRQKGRSSQPDYYAGDVIPNSSAKYYMVIFRQSQDTAPAVRATQNKYDEVYFVGDSRTLGMRNALKNQAPENIKFVFKAGQGLQWFKTTGFSQLYKTIKSQPQSSRKAVVINLGVNDLTSRAAYAKYMKTVAQKLKPYNCTMYYLSVNPVNNAMIVQYHGYNTKAKTEAKVQKFNRYIYNNLCSGSKAPFKYINTWSGLRKNGWISSKNNTNTYDGVHYSNETYLRIYDYCIRVLNR